MVDVGEPRVDRRSRILALELAELPLPGEEPQRIAHLGAQAAVEFDARGRPSSRFQPRIAGSKMRLSRKSCWLPVVRMAMAVSAPWLGHGGRVGDEQGRQQPAGRERHQRRRRDVE